MTAASSESGPSAWILSASVPPRMKVCAMYGMPLCSPTSSTGTTFGCTIRWAILASRSKRRRTMSSRAMSSLSSLSATSSPCVPNAR